MIADVYDVKAQALASLADGAPSRGLYLTAFRATGKVVGQAVSHNGAPEVIGQVMGAVRPTGSGKNNLYFRVAGNAWEWTIDSDNLECVGNLSQGRRDPETGPVFVPFAKTLGKGTAQVSLKNAAGLPDWVVAVTVGRGA